MTRRPATSPLLEAVIPSAERGTCSRLMASCTASPTFRGERNTCTREAVEVCRDGCWVGSQGALQR